MIDLVYSRIIEVGSREDIMEYFEDAKQPALETWHLNIGHALQL